MLDQYGRSIDYLRISVTDKCNFRCIYCMPGKGVANISHENVLRFEEIVRICSSAANLGIRKIKITGGEPLVRRGVCELIRQIHGIEGIDAVTLTTNGYRLCEFLPQLRDAGISGINVSLDTLDENRFRQITKHDGLEQVKKGIDCAVQLGISSIKINCVPMQANRCDLADIALLAKDRPVHVRFIEMMPIGMGRKHAGIPQDEVRALLEPITGSLISVQEKLGNGPAVYYRAEGFRGRIGFISAMTHEFCRDCNRVRLTVDGYLKLCLNHVSSINLRDFLRNGASDEQLEQYMKEEIYKKPSHHGFLEENLSDTEKRSMNGIGG